jgi:hypothetical protein
MSLEVMFSGGFQLLLVADCHRRFVKTCNYHSCRYLIIIAIVMKINSIFKLSALDLAAAKDCQVHMV